MTRRLVIGTRNNGDSGIFVSPPGVDAFTAADSTLLLTIASKVSQLLLLGQISSSGTVALGLSANPFVFLTTQNPYSDGFFTLSGPTRPSPCATVIMVGGGGASLQRGNLASAVINSSGASLSVTTGAKCIYAVFNRAI